MDWGLNLSGGSRVSLTSILMLLSALPLQVSHLVGYSDVEPYG